MSLFRGTVSGLCLQAKTLNPHEIIIKKEKRWELSQLIKSGTKIPLVIGEEGIENQKGF